MIQLPIPASNIRRARLLFLLNNFVRPTIATYYGYKGTMAQNQELLSEKVTLVLQEHRLEFNKTALVLASRYFASLFSHNFKDSDEKEHVINYDISISTLQTFQDWLNDFHCNHDDKHTMKPSLRKFMADCYSELLDLLELSILFMVDSLTDDITDILVQQWLTPKNAIRIWILAEELGLNMLKNICIGVCLDRFNEIPLQTVVKLSKDNFMLLVDNANLRTSKLSLKQAVRAWEKHRLEKLDVKILDNRIPKLLQCLLVMYEPLEQSRMYYIYCWNDTKLCRMISVNDTWDSIKDLVGMQFTGRGFDVYLIGGEYGIGTGRFNQSIWRYSLLGHKWFYHARLPTVRRHMIAVFMGAKLIVVGGVGRHRIKQNKVEILDIHAGEWTTGASIPENFAEVPTHCVFKNRLFVLLGCIYIYCPQLNTWKTVLICDPTIQKAQAMILHNSRLFFIRTGWNGTTYLTMIENTQNEMCNTSDSFEPCHCNNTLTVYSEQVCADFNLSFDLRYGGVIDGGILCIGDHKDLCINKYLHTRNELRADLDNCSINPRRGTFFVVDPETLRSKAL